MKRYWQAMAMVLAMACAAVQHDPLYDGSLIPGGEIIAQASDSVVLVPIKIENSRARDAADPVFYLIGNGKHSLGSVPDLSTKRLFVDSRWLDSPDGQITIVAHYIGGSDLIYESFPYRAGEVIDISLDPTFNRVAAWAH